MSHSGESASVWLWEELLHGPTRDSKAVLFDPERWGVSAAAIPALAGELQRFGDRYAAGFRTATRDASPYAAPYVGALLRMEGRRTFASIGRHVGLAGQNVQHFVSNSPWSAAGILRQVREEIAARPELRQGGVLIVDESPVKKAGTKTAGAARQWNGRSGHVDLSQVGTFLAYANGATWTWVDGELFLPERWLGPDRADERERLGIPAERTFKTKVELGWEMIQRAQAEGLPFEAFAWDELDGRSGWLRARLDKAKLVYLANVPADTRVYLAEPRLGIPDRPPGQRGPQIRRRQIISATGPVEARALAARTDAPWQRVRVRSVERGELADEFAAWLVWTIRDQAVAQEWLLVGRTSQGTCSYTLSNAPPATTLEQLARLRCQRYWIERANQDAKSETGWDERQAQKFRAWEHQLALTILATWFVAETTLDWARQHPRDPTLVTDLATDRLPGLSVANVRTMLRAAMPLPDLTTDRAAALIVEHLVNRTRSRRRRRNHQFSFGHDP
jgi:SRSO17 transposase